VGNGDPEIEGTHEADAEEMDVVEQPLLAAPDGKDSDNTDIDTEVLPFSPEFLEGAPPELKRAMQMFFSMSKTSVRASNPLAAAVAKVLSSDHLASLIGLMERSEERELCNAQRVRWANLLYLIVVLIFAGFAVWLLEDSNPDLLKDLITIAATLAGGLGAGYGIKTWAERKQQ